MFKKSAFDLLSVGKNGRIISLCQEFDEAIDNNGIRCGVITEIAGAPGCGKTQIW